MGGGGSAKIPTSLTDFVCVGNEIFELQNKVSIQNLLCCLFVSTVTAEVGADFFNFGLTAKNLSVKGGPSRWGGGGGKATWPWGPNMFYFFLMSLPLLDWIFGFSWCLFGVSLFSFENQENVLVRILISTTEKHTHNLLLISVLDVWIFLEQELELKVHHILACKWML